MKRNFSIVFEFRATAPHLITNIDFYGSRLQADRAFYALSYALVNSDCEALHLFCGETEVATTKFNNNNATLNIKKG